MWLRLSVALGVALLVQDINSLAAPKRAESASQPAQHSTDEVLNGAPDVHNIDDNGSVIEGRGLRNQIKVAADPAREKKMIEKYNKEVDQLLEVVTAQLQKDEQMQSMDLSSLLVSANERGRRAANERGRRVARRVYAGKKGRTQDPEAVVREDTLESTDEELNVKNQNPHRRNNKKNSQNRPNKNKNAQNRPNNKKNAQNNRNKNNQRLKNKAIVAETARTESIVHARHNGLRSLRRNGDVTVDSSERQTRILAVLDINYDMGRQGSIEVKSPQLKANAQFIARQARNAERLRLVGLDLLPTPGNGKTSVGRAVGSESQVMDGLELASYRGLTFDTIAWVLDHDNLIKSIKDSPEEEVA